MANDTEGKADGGKNDYFRSNLKKKRLLVRPSTICSNGTASVGTEPNETCVGSKPGSCKATQEKRWGKVKALQRLLTHSFSGKALAVRRVTENQGKKTPGVDKVIWDTPEKKAQAIRDLKPRGYHPQPLRRVYIPKSNGAQRPLSIPTMKDRAMQALYLLALQPVAETLADPHSYGFRPNDVRQTRSSTATLSSHKSEEQNGS